MDKSEPEPAPRRSREEITAGLRALSPQELMQLEETILGKLKWGRRASRPGG